ncbi:MAG: GNAT family N-acetyltransferase [Dehalococcoidia bacterium]
MRDSTDADISLLVEIVNAAYKPVDFWLFQQLRTSEEDFRHETRKPGAQSIVAELDAAVVAHVALWLEDGDAWIGLFATAPEAQGQGIATVLAEEAERRARTAGYRQLRLGCVRENGLQPYYESLGYRVEREEHGRMWDATQEWTHVYMVKELR